MDPQVVAVWIINSTNIEKEVVMARARQFIDAPRLQVVLVPESENVNVATALFDIGLVLHVPDGKPPTTVRVDGGPFDRGDAVTKLEEIWNYLGQKYAEPAQP